MSLSFTFQQQTWEIFCTTQEICEGHGTWVTPPLYPGFVPQLWALSSNLLPGKSHSDFPRVLLPEDMTDKA